jgi:hypothetical protein
LEGFYTRNFTFGTHSFAGSTRTTNLGVRSSNLFGRAKNRPTIVINSTSKMCHAEWDKFAWHLHGTEEASQ